ncbi:MAG: hypothetical protein [Wigfec virus K19_81]|nr:MAG: hypothetical protein [Wigfec virus K19_81]
MEKYITIQGLNQSITHKITSWERLSLYKAWKNYVKNKTLNELGTMYTYIKNWDKYEQNKR